MGVFDGVAGAVFGEAHRSVAAIPDLVARHPGLPRAHRPRALGAPRCWPPWDCASPRRGAGLSAERPSSGVRPRSRADSSARECVTTPISYTGKPTEGCVSASGAPLQGDPARRTVGPAGGPDDRAGRASCCAAQARTAGCPVRVLPHLGQNRRGLRRRRRRRVRLQRRIGGGSVCSTGLTTIHPHRTARPNAHSRSRTAPGYTT